MEKPYDHIVYSMNVIEFATVANEYCHFLENAQSYKDLDFIGKIQKIVALTYLKASLLPDFPKDMPDNVECPEKFVTEEDWNAIHNKVFEKFGNRSYYIEIYNPMTQDHEKPYQASIAEDIADIYQDMKDFITLYRYGVTDIMNDALWECKRNFIDCWGQRAVNALRAIHMAYYMKEKTKTDIPVSKPKTIKTAKKNKQEGTDHV